MNLVGRSVETAAIDGLLSEARSDRGGVLVLSGEAGVGKSALLHHAQDSAQGMTVLRATGIEGESELPYAALHQVLRPLFERIDRLPAPQAAALRAAFALSGESVQERFRVSLGVLGLLSDAAVERPLLCVIDDAQWLDHASADALLFVARRLEVEPIALLFAARTGDARSFVAPGLPDHRVAALDPPDAHSLLSARLGLTIGPEAADWIVRYANGNPLALLELPGALTPGQLAGREPLRTHLSETTSVEQVYLERVNGLAPGARALLLLAAAEETGERGVLERAATSLQLNVVDLADAEAAGLVGIDAKRVVFHHPLVRSAVYRGAGFADRERAHAALAEILSAPDEADRRAWHRAAATVGQDEEVALELERTADRARLRSGYSAAASALERAAELTADDGARARRLVAAVTAAWHAGDPVRALALADRARPLVDNSRLSAELEHVRGDIEHRRGQLQAAGAILLAGADSAAGVDSGKALEMLFDAASCGMQSGDYALVGEAGRRAAKLPRRDDDRERFLADLLIGVGSLWLGQTTAELPLVLDVIERAHTLDEPRLLTGAAMGASTVGDEASEAEFLLRAVSLARQSGAVDAVSLTLLSTAVAGILGGRFTVAAEAAEGLRLAREARLTGVAGLQLAIIAWFTAVRGEVGEARAAAAEAVESAVATGNALTHSIAVWALTLLDLSRGKPEAAVTRLAELAAAPIGVAHPLIVLMASPDLVEACVRAGRGDQAANAHAALEAFAEPAGPAWARALSARCTALLSEDAAAESSFQRALDLHAEANRPFDHARTRLLYGEFLRRSRRRQDAREHLRAAFATFEQLRRGALGRARSGGAAGDRRVRADARLEHGRGADPAGAADRPARRRGRLEQGRRSAALPQPPHRRIPPAQGLPEARDCLPQRADPARNRNRARRRAGVTDQ